MSELYMNFTWYLPDNYPKNMFPFFEGGGARPPLPPSPTAMVPGVRGEILLRHQTSEASRRFARVLERPCLASVER